jgi:hypothetical protein
MTLVEKVARAMFEAATGSGYAPFEDQPPDTQGRFQAQARAALAAVREALREPTPEMKQSGTNALAGWVAPTMHAAEAWRAMLAASPLMEADDEQA